MSTVETVYDYAGALLAVCDDAIASTAAGAIDRAFVSPGLPSIDCATLAVTVVTLGEANTGSGALLAPGHRHRLSAINLLGFAVTIARDCVPVADGRSARPATVADLEEAAGIVLADVWTVWNAITEAMDCGELFGGRCTELFMEGAAALATSGMTAGFVLSLSTAIGGIPRECEPEPPSGLVEYPFTVDGPLTDPWIVEPSPEVVFSYDGYVPEAVAGVVTGVPGDGVNTAAVRRPDLSPVSLVGCVVDVWGDSGGNNPVSLFLATGLSEWVEFYVTMIPDGFMVPHTYIAVDHYWNDGDDQETVIASTEVTALPAGAAVALRITGTTATVEADAGGDPEALAVIGSGSLTPIVGDLQPAFVVWGNSAISRLFVELP